jgi:hypothetical protein
MSADVSCGEHVARVLAAIDRELPPLRGIVHAAGVLDVGVLAQQNLERFSRVLAPKVAGAWHLHLGTLDRQLDFFVLFSSIAGVLGSPGQGNYAAANVFLDALAHERRRLGLPALSIAWGPWADGGMAASVGEANRQRWAANGFESIQPDDALRLFGQLLSADAAHAIVMPMQPNRMEAKSGEVPPLFSDLVVGAGPEPSALETEDLRVRLERARPNRRRAVLHAFLCEQAREVFGFDPSAPFDPKQGLRELGMDSLTSIELRNRLQRSVGETLPSTLAFDYPTVDAMSRFLADEVLGLSPAGDESEAPEARTDAPLAPAALLSKVEDLSDEEIDRLLATKIAARSL